MQVDKESPARERRRGSRQSESNGKPGRRKDTGGLGERLRALGPEASEFVRRLSIANEFCMWKQCSRETCRRAERCRGEDVECFDEQRGELKRAILELVIWLMCTADISSNEFYDYLDEVTADADDDEYEA